MVTPLLPCWTMLPLEAGTEKVKQTAVKLWRKPQGHIQQTSWAHIMGSQQKTDSTATHCVQ